MSIRIIKILRDLASDYGKNAMLVLAMALGVLGIGTILGAYGVLNREMASNYNGTNPASATLEITPGITTELLDSVKQFPGIKEAERHATVSARMKVGDVWYPILLFVIDDFSHKAVNKITHISGHETPDLGEMLVERTALSVMHAVQGDSIVIKTADGRAKTLYISGTVHDAGLAPAWQQQSGFGYITLSTMKLLNTAQVFDQLRITVTENPLSSQAVTEKTEALAGWLEKQGYSVGEIQIPPPGKHPHQSQMKAVLTIFIVFSFLILVLGSILVSTSVSTVMVRQVRQIGIMKTIGATTAQIVKMYVGMIVLICTLALLVAIPLSWIAAAALFDRTAVLLNLEMTNRSIPYEVPLLQIVSGITIPLVAAAFPVLRGSFIGIKDALDNYGISSSATTQSKMMQLANISFFSTSLKLSLRNVFRLRSRLIMVVSLLAVAGAMFMTALNVAAAWDDNLARIYQQRLYDVEIRLTEEVLPDTILPGIRSLPGIKSAEGWGYSAVTIPSPGGRAISRTYPDKGHGSFSLLALPPQTKLLNPTITEGKWLSGKYANEVVVNQLARGKQKELKLGDSLQLSIDGKATYWKVVGFCEDVGAGATVYTSINDFTKVATSTGGVKMLRIAYADRTRDFAYQKNSEIEKLLEQQHITIDTIVPVWLLRNAVAAHMKVLVNSLIAMAIIMAIVGTLGLASVMSMSVMERTKEIGVMRAIGGTPIKITTMLIYEGLFIGIISIAVSFLLGIALSIFMGDFIGNLAFKTPLSLTISATALLEWLSIVVLGAIAAAWFPAKRAGALTIREALAYE